MNQKWARLWTEDQPATVDYRTSPQPPMGNRRRKLLVSLSPVTGAATFGGRRHRSRRRSPDVKNWYYTHFFIIFRKNRILEVWFFKLDILCKTWLRDGLGYEQKPIRSSAGPPNSKNEYYTQFSSFFARVMFMMSIFWNWTSFIKYVWEMDLVMN